MKSKLKTTLKILGGIPLLLLVGYVYLLFTEVPDISDRDVHKTGNSQVDIHDFNDGVYSFPDSSWMVYDNPDKLGWDTDKLNDVGNYADNLESAALMVIHKGVLIYDWGATDEKYITQSMRKGLLSSLYGAYWDQGKIDLNTTLGELGVDDNPPLTKTERTATIENLLQSSSGIYHSALYELGQSKREKPARGTHRPGETWYYNNWDFNALGTIFEQIIDQKLGVAFKDKIATPLQMQDFASEDVAYITQENLGEKMMGNQSEHPAYMFSMSARDMARFGLLYLSKGNWNGKQILSEEWLEKSWDPVAIEMYQGVLNFGYLWWVFENGDIYVNKDMGFEGDIYFTSGNRGHAVFVIPYLDLVVVHRVYIKGVNGWNGIKRGALKLYADVDDDDVYEMLRMIREAHPKYNR